MDKHKLDLALSKNAFIDRGDGRLEFPQGLEIINGGDLRNGYKYDMETLDISEYQGQVTADHQDLIEKIIAGVEGIEKQGNRVIIRAINYLINESALGRLAYALAINPKVPTNFSIETYGPYPDNSDDTYYKAKLVGLSQVVVGNCKGAALNELNTVVQNSLEQSEKDGLDVGDLKNKLLEYKPKNKETKIMFKTVKNTRDFDVEVHYKNAAEEYTTSLVKAGQSIDVSEEQASSIEAQIATASEQVDVNSLVADALKESQEQFDTQINELKKELANSAVKTPEFKKDKDGKVIVTAGESAFAEMSWQDRVINYVNAVRNKDQATINEINSLHKAQLEAAGKTRNALDFEAFGNFVTPPELLTTIERDENQYRMFADLFSWIETNSLKTGWLESDGGIILRSVDMCEDEDNVDGNLKPIEDYSATAREVNLSEYAAVTPVCSAATKFLAVDLLQDAALVYREAYDRKRAELIIAALQAAVDTTGQKSPYVVNPAIKGLTSLIWAWNDVKRSSSNGRWFFNNDTETILLQYAVEAGTQEPFQMFTKNPDGSLSFLGRPYTVVPNEIMPSVAGGTVSFEVAGETVTITEGVFYAPVDKVLARVGSGGFNYDVNIGAAYEVGSGETRRVYSAYQRDQVLLRGYTYAVAGVRRNKAVGSITAGAIS